MVPRPASLAKLAFVLVTLLVVGGVVGFAVGLLGTPDVVGLDNTFGTVNDTATTIETDLRVHNPNPFGATFGETTVDYRIELNGVELAGGTKEGVALESGNSTLSFATRMDNGKIPAWWAAHVADGERSTLAVHADVRPSWTDRSFDAPAVEREIETDLISEFNSEETRPIDADVPLVRDPVLYVDETSAEWGDVSRSTTPIEMAFVVHNPRNHPVAITRLRYEVTMNDVPVGGGETDRAHVITPGATETVETTAWIDNDRLDEWWVTHLDEDVEGHQVSELRIEFSAVVDLSAVGAGEVEVPLSELTYAETIETDIFGEREDDDADERAADRTNSEVPEATIEFYRSAPQLRAYATEYPGS